MTNTRTFVEEYALSGGGKVRVVKPFGDRNYCAIVEQDGRYPESGKNAHNRGRREFSYVLEGSFTFIIDGAKSTLKKNGSILIDDGQVYSIEGKGRILVVVEDKAGGKTAIE
jgi:mannose-6-phosphate isomerase-like protein (cupin superfamily)